LTIFVNFSRLASSLLGSKWNNIAYFLWPKNGFSCPYSICPYSRWRL